MNVWCGPNAHEPSPSRFDTARCRCPDTFETCDGVPQCGITGHRSAEQIRFLRSEPNVMFDWLAPVHSPRLSRVVVDRTPKLRFWIAAENCCCESSGAHG